MPSFVSERPQPSLVPPSFPRTSVPESAKPEAAKLDAPNAAVQPRASRQPTGILGLLFSIVLAAFWAGASAAYMWGYLGPKGLSGLDVQEIALFAAAVFVPPMLFIAGAWTLARGYALNTTVRALSDQVDRLFQSDELSARTASRLGRSIRAELDGLNSGIDAAFTRMRALEGVLQAQIGALDEAGARADVRGDAIAAKLAEERARMEEIAAALGDTAQRASDFVKRSFLQEGEKLHFMAMAVQEKMTLSGADVSNRFGEECAKLEASSEALASMAQKASADVGRHFEEERARLEAMTRALAVTAQSAGADVTEKFVAQRALLESTHAAFAVEAAQAGENIAAHFAGERARVEQLAAELGEIARQSSEATRSQVLEEQKRLQALTTAIGESALRASEKVGENFAEEERHLSRMNEDLADAAESARTRLIGQFTEERERFAAVANHLSESAARASEQVAGRGAQLKAMIESAEATLKTAGASLDTQARNFRAASDAAADSPRKAALELDSHAKKIEQVSDAAMARAEFVLGRHERHRSAMGDILVKLRQESAGLDAALTAQREALEKTVNSLLPQARRIETLTSDTEHHLEMIMANAEARAKQVSENLAQDAAKLKDITEAAGVTMAKLADAMREAGASANMLIGETAAEARSNANALVGEAMAECEKLIRAAGEINAQSREVRVVVGETIEELHGHLLTLPGIAQQEAQRVRDLVRGETEEILDLSARTIATIHARIAARNAPKPEENAEQDHDSLLARARRLTNRPKRRAIEARPADPNGKWEMSTLLSAVEPVDSNAKELKPAAAAALGALEAALADMALDLAAFDNRPPPGEDEWRRYLAGDRVVFARRLADAIDSDAVNRITNLYRENPPFREAADAYMAEFEAMLKRAKDGDSGGLLASTLLSADTGKIYLALGYALGRLS